MWFVEWLVSILVFPVRWFWQEYHKLSEEKCVWKLILLFVGSLSGILLIGFALIWLGCYLINYHLPLLVAIGLIVWLYAYVKSKLDEKAQSVRDKISLEDRVKLIGDVESLHTFAYIINRTRRRDIGNFTLRKPETLKVSFTPEQQEHFDRKDGDLYNELYFDDSTY